MNDPKLANKALELQYSARHIVPNPYFTISHGEGVYVYDTQGQRYLDMAAGVSVANFGHRHPRLIHALMEQANKIAVPSRLFHTETLGPFLAQACALTQMDLAVPMNSGAEAVETAIKALRKWGYLKKNIAQDQAEIIVCADNFHGRTVTTISMSTLAKYKNYFWPLTPGFKVIPYNDVPALTAAITANTVGFIVEPIQGEAGVVIPAAGYLEQCAGVCRQHNVPIIFDEIQVGMGRTGKFLASQYEAVQPDGILLGKALGGGLLPISLFLAKKSILEVFEPGDHGSTFGGNALAAHVAKNALDILLEENLISQAQELGAYFLAKLQQLQSPVIKSVRGRGLIIGLEINTDFIKSSTVSQALIKAGLLNINTRDRVIRLLPPLIITRAQLDEAFLMICDTLAILQSSTV